MRGRTVKQQGEDFGQGPFWLIGRWLYHRKAVMLGTAERYVLAELRDAERDHFEEHMFSCPVCARNVSDLAVLTEGVREVVPNYDTPRPLPEPAPARPLRLPWFRFNPNYAWCLLLAMSAGFSGYEHVQLREASVHLDEALSPRAVTPVLLKGKEHAPAKQIKMERVGPFLRDIAMDLPGATGKLQWEVVRTDADKVVCQGTADAPDQSGNFQVRIPYSMVSPGEYKLTVRSLGPESHRPWSTEFTLIPIGS